MGFKVVVRKSIKENENMFGFGIFFQVYRTLIITGVATTSDLKR